MAASELEPDSSNIVVKAPFFDDLIVALQKSFSRVSAATDKSQREKDATAPCAMVVGPVKFSLSLNVDMDKDRLRVQENGSIRLSIDGTLQTDVRVAAVQSDAEGTNG